MSPRRFSGRVYTSASRKASPLPAPLGRKRTALERMNKSEAAYAAHLDGEESVAAWWFEGMSWRLADDTLYKPDFVVLRQSGRLEVHEVKAAAKKGADFGVTELSWAKIKVAAEHCPFPVVVTWQHNGVWHQRWVGGSSIEHAA